MPGIGAYLNAAEGTFRQARRALQTADGVIFFAVGDTTPNSTSANSTNAAIAHNPFAHGKATPKRTNADFFVMLRGALFAQKTVPPPMPWKTSPATGSVMGFARDANGALLDGAPVTIEPGARILTTDGGGFFGALGLAPGDYHANGCAFAVAAGRVTRIDLPCRAAANAAP